MCQPLSTMCGPGWHSRPVRILQPGSRFEQLFLDYLAQLGTAGSLTTDTPLAALAVEHQAELHGADTDFARFDGLRWLNPLKAAI